MKKFFMCTKMTNSNECKFYISFIVIAYCSYGGMLTSWMRFKYPNLVDGGLAGSAPIYYTEGIVSRTAFFGKVTQVHVIE